MSASGIQSTPLVGVTAAPQLYRLSGRRLLGNTAWSVLGSAAPLAVAVFAIPLLIHGLGNDRFGVLTLAWTLIGYFGIFDLGLGRALTKVVAEKAAVGREAEIPASFWTCLGLLLLVGCAGGLVVGPTAGWLTRSVLKIPVGLQAETIIAFRIIAATIPVVSTASGLRGYLEARQRFASVSMVRMMVGILGFIGPVLVLPFSRSLVAVIATLAVARLVTWAGFLFVCLKVSPELWTERRTGGVPWAPLLRFGGWVTVSNVVSPLMVSMDRFMMASLLSIGMVAYYVTPQEMITKLLVLPMALQTVVFPAFSGSLSNGCLEARALYRRGIDNILLALFPIAVGLATCSRELLTVWLGPQFSSQSYRIMPWLAAGILINGVAHVPAALLQGGDRPDICAKLHLVELPLYALAAWFLMVRFGIEGAAVAWVLRVALDAGMLLWIARRWVPGLPFNPLHLTLGSAVFAAGAGLTAASAPAPQKIAFALLVVTGTAALGWRFVRKQILS